MIEPSDNPAIATTADAALAALREVLFADASIAGWPCVMRFDALPVSGPYIALSIAPDMGTAVIGEAGEFVCCEADALVRVACDVDDPAADAYAATRAAIWRALTDAPAMVSAGVSRVFRFSGEDSGGTDASRLVSTFTVRLLLEAATE